MIGGGGVAQKAYTKTDTNIFILEVCALLIVDALMFTS